MFAADPDKKHAEYMKETIADKSANVSTLDRKDLWAYLSGEKDSSAKIDITMPAYVVPEEERRDDATMAEADDEPAVHPLHEELDPAVRQGLRRPSSGFSGAKQVDKKREREQQVVPLPTNRFGDVKEEQFYREAMGKDMLEMGIDPNMSFLDNKRQRLRQMSEADRLRGEALLGGGARTGTQRKVSSSNKQQRKDPVAGQRPIIIVPAGYGSKVMFNMWPRAGVLAKEKLVTWESMHKAGEKHSSITLKRKYKRPKSKQYPERATSSTRSRISRRTRRTASRGRASSPCLSPERNGSSRTGRSRVRKMGIWWRRSTRCRVSTPSTTSTPPRRSSRSGTFDARFPEERAARRQGAVRGFLGRGGQAPGAEASQLKY